MNGPAAIPVRHAALLLTITLCFGFCGLVNSLSVVPEMSEMEVSNLTQRLLKTVDKKVRPNLLGGPTLIKCDLYVYSMSSISEVNMDYQLTLHFRLRWEDRRLAYTEPVSSLIIPPSDISDLWIPDVYFPNEKASSQHNVVIPNKGIRLLPNGTVCFATRLTLKMSCDMDLSYFPLDSQSCEMKISTYSHRTEDVLLQWLDDTPVELPGDTLTLPQFQLLNVKHGQCTERYKTGEYPCLKATFNMRREIGFYVLQTYIPSVLIVSLSWLSFWVDKDAVPGRVTLGVTTVLTMTTQLSSSKTSNMKVSYPKAIDYWYSMCMLLVYGALVEYVLVNFLATREKRLQRQLQADADDETIVEANKCSEVIVCVAEAKRNHSTSLRRPVATRTTSSTIFTADGFDKASRIIFPGTFLVFNIVYWSVCYKP
ncbi:Glycine receptor subunit alpha-2 [Lamellibrachia satsuma]|nr:Glycine receptor subunit alpha-2 [Lamellibrachia satsuma]